MHDRPGCRRPQRRRRRRPRTTPAQLSLAQRSELPTPFAPAADPSRGDRAGTRTPRRRRRLPVPGSEPLLRSPGFPAVLGISSADRASATSTGPAGGGKSLSGRLATRRSNHSAASTALVPGRARSWTPQRGDGRWRAPVVSGSSHALPGVGGHGHRPSLPPRVDTPPASSASLSRWLRHRRGNVSSAATRECYLRSVGPFLRQLIWVRGT